MLDQDAYVTGMAVYLGAGGLASLYFAWWLSRRWANSIAIALGLVAAALLLTPAYQGADAQTMAPALVVAAFEWLTNGPEAAAHAIRPLSAALAAAVAIGALVLLLGWLLGRRNPDPEQTST